MGYIKFDKSQLINLEYSLNKEILNVNNLGAFYNSTLLLCNTRKYHGLLICPVEEFDYQNHVLLSSLDETVVQKGAEFHLGIHKFPCVYSPRGHKYARNFDIDPIPKITYRVGGVVLEKEILIVENEYRILIKYILKEAQAPVSIQLRPFLAFRNIHGLSKANLFANTKYKPVGNGIKMKLYNGFPSLYLQTSKKTEYIPAPNWYYNFEYIEEQKRGYDFQEDLYSPGFFEFPIKKDEIIIFSAGLDEVPARSLKQKFINELEKVIPKNNFNNCLKSSAKQFIVKHGKKTEIIAGYPWFGRWGRDTFISLPGLTLSLGDTKTCKDVLDTMVFEMKKGLFPNNGKIGDALLNSVDAPLWFFWAVKKYQDHSKEPAEKIWKEFGPKMKQILKSYREGTDYNIKMRENGLIYAGEKGYALTWMDAVVDGKPVTPREGYAVEINVLWYFAIKYALFLALKNEDNKFITDWDNLPGLIEKSFVAVFWDENKKYLADYVNDEEKDWSVRPNQVFASSLEYSPVNEDIKKAVIDKIQKELLTPKGLRTLSPKNPAYIGIYQGDQASRDKAYHQGTVWPWLLGHFAEGYLRLYKKNGIPFVKDLLNKFEDEIKVHGMGTISEVFDGDPPHKPGGAISQAWSVAELLRMNELIKKYSKK